MTRYDVTAAVEASQSGNARQETRTERNQKADLLPNSESQQKSLSSLSASIQDGFADLAGEKG